MKKIVRIFAITLIIIFAAALTLFSRQASILTADGLRVCTVSVIPSLFPYMVISQMLVSSGIFALPKKLFYPVRIYGLPEKCGSVILMGALCGFPVGAKTAVEMYKKGELSKTEAEVLICAANNTGPSFVVSVIGATFFKSISFGWKLYGFQMISSVIATLTVNRLIFPFRGTKSTKEKTSLVMPDIFSAVRESVFSTLTVCGFIVFFFVVSGFAVPFISSFSKPLGDTVAALLEFSGGARAAAAQGGARGRFFCGLAVGFSGISVFCQTASFTSKEKLSLKRCFCTKLFQGILTGCFAASPLAASKASNFIPMLEEVGFIQVSPLPIALLSSFLYIIAANTVLKE